MKRTIFLSISCMLLLLVTSPSSYAQRTFTIKINGSPYYISESDMNDCFAYAFKAMVNNGVTKEKYFDLWVGTYKAWKDYRIDGEQIYETMGDRITSSGFSKTIPNAFHGLKPNDSAASGSPHNKDNTAMRVAMLHYYLPPFLINKLTGKAVK